GALRLRVDELDGAQSLGIDDGAGGEHAGELGIADRGEDRLDGIHLQDDVRLQSFRGEETIDELGAPNSCDSETSGSRASSRMRTDLRAASECRAPTTNTSASSNSRSLTMCSVSSER